MFTDERLNRPMVSPGANSTEYHLNMTLEQQGANSTQDLNMTLEQGANSTQDLNMTLEQQDANSTQDLNMTLEQQGANSSQEHIQKESSYWVRNRMHITNLGHEDMTRDPPAEQFTSAKSYTNAGSAHMNQSHVTDVQVANSSHGFFKAPSVDPFAKEANGSQYGYLLLRVLEGIDREYGTLAQLHTKYVLSVCWKALTVSTAHLHTCTLAHQHTKYPKNQMKRSLGKTF